MEFFNFKDKSYVSVKNHTYMVINGFQSSYLNPYYFQAIKRGKGQINKEYLPKGFDVVRTGRIYTVYKKAEFNYTGSPNSLIWIAPHDEDNAEFLGIKWGLDYIGKSHLLKNLNTYLKENDEGFYDFDSVDRVVSGQVLYAVRVNDIDWFIRQIETKLAVMSAAEERELVAV